MKLACVLLLTALGSWPLAAQCPDGSAPPCRTSRVSPPANSVAVFYFDNGSPDTADLYLADGLSEALMARLGRVDRLAVKSRAAVARYRRVPGDAVSFARALGVATFVDGNVRRVGHRLRIIAELVRTSSGDAVWIETYERGESDLLGVEEEIARAVATAITGRLQPREREAVARRPTRNPAAYEHFLRGNYALAQRNQTALTAAIAEFETAARLDTLFALAAARAAYADALACEYGHPTLGCDSLVVRGFAAAGQALGRDSSVADAWMALGLLRSVREVKSPAGALAAYERAVSLDPRNAEALHQYGDLLAAIGRDSSAVAIYNRALAVEPERAITLMSLARLNLAARRYAEAMRWADSALSVDPAFLIGHGGRFTIAWYTGDTAAARAEAVWLRGPSPALLDYRGGDTLGARRRVAAALAPLVSTTGPLRIDVAVGATFTLVESGQSGVALEVLERAQPRGVALWAWLRMPWFDPLRNDPRFQRLVEESRPE